MHEEENEPANGDPADADQRGAAERLLWKYSQIEEQDGDFRQRQNGKVEGFVNVEELEGVAEDVWFDFPYVDAERKLAS